MNDEEDNSLAARLKARLANLGQDYCVFSRSGREFAISVTAAHEVLTGEVATPVPQAPPALVGVINLRGSVLPLVQVDGLLGLPTRPYTPGDQLVVLTAGDVEIGLVVDRVRDVRAINANDITVYPSDSPAAHLCRGAWAGPTGSVAVLDPAKVVAAAAHAITVRFQQRVSGRVDDPVLSASASPRYE